ncbi:MAG: DUF349 domain-containing protein [Candidatus Competibacterales bacterium]
MILERIFKPKWQHADPEQRILAIQELAADDATLGQLAREDTSPKVRIAALERLVDLGDLEALSRDTDPAVAEAARRHYQRLVAGEVADVELDARRVALEGGDGALAAFVLVHGDDPELRLAALARTSAGDAVLHAALEDSSAAVRLAAAEQLDDPEALEQVARASRNRDKRLFRIVRGKLDAAKAVTERRDTLLGLCERLERLAADTSLNPNDTRLYAIDQAWQAQGVLEAIPDDLVERYRATWERIRNRQGESAAERVARLGICSALEDLSRRLDAAAILDDALAGEAQGLLAEAATKAEDQDPEAQVEIQRIERLTSLVRRRHDELVRDRERAVAQQEILQQLEKLAEHKAPREREVAKLRQQWAELSSPANEDLAAVLNERFEAAMASLEERLAQQKSQLQGITKHLEAQVEELEKVLAAGELGRAVELDEQLRTALKDSPLPKDQRAKFNERLAGLRNVLGELRAWRRWGSNQARDNLCAEAETLVGAELSPPEIAKRVQQLREQWKAMDHREGAATKALWERFNEACEKAYEPCIAHFEAQAKERAQNLAKRAALCERLEALERDSDWNNPDWRSADRTRNDVNNQWHKAGPVDRSERKVIDKRYKKALQQVDQRLAAERERGVQRREALIQRVEGLVEHEDLRAAIEGAKGAQAEWQPTVLASRRQEQELWQRFRAACDAIFARRQAQAEAADAERRQNRERKVALLEELEGLAKAEPEDYARGRERIKAIEREWESIGVVPRGDQNALERRLEAARRGVERRGKELERLKRRRAMEGLRQRAELCGTLEALALDAAQREGCDLEQAVADAKAAWEALAPLKHPAVATLKKRFDAACRGAADPGTRANLEQQLTANLPAKRTLCLRMEILAEIDSPPEYAKARMEYQVTRLSESLVNRETLIPEKEAQEVESTWYATPIPPGDEYRALGERFDRALEVFHQGTKTKTSA